VLPFDHEAFSDVSMDLGQRCCAQGRMEGYLNKKHLVCPYLEIKKIKRALASQDNNSAPL
jgi:hypothetical protein